MKKTTYVNNGLVFLFFLISLHSFSQNFVPFSPRFNQDLKGDIVLIGNNILGSDNNAFNDTSVYNHNVDMKYIDIDGDASTFSSSSADLVIQNPNCYRIIHAGLYWGAVTEGTQPFTNVKFKGPTGGYNDIVGTIVFDADGTTVDGGDSFPYACYADVTSIVTSLANDLGTYTVANVSSSEGRTGSFSPSNNTGYSAGWSLFIVFEDPTMPGKSITSFDGFSSISVAGGNPTLDIPVSGFRTIPAPAPVRANFAFATLEGDSPILGDQLLLNGSNLSTADRPATNFFNSSVTQLSALPVNNRNPNSANTLGFDTGVMVVPNPSNTVIANNATSGTVRLETSGDTFFPYFFALAVEIIEPNIVLTKIVEDEFGNNIGGQVVDLGDELYYTIGFQNTGNDYATNLTIRDILPTNIVFNYPSDIGVLPAGVTVQSYNPSTRELIFSVDPSVVEVNDPVSEIRFKVTVVATCSLLSDACSNNIDNQAYSTYQGTINPDFTISDDPSFATNAGCLLTPGATNFLADLNDCTFEEEVVLCGASVTLTAGSGYDAYSWSTSPSGTPVIGTTQSITVTNTGSYYVHNTAVAPCQSIDQVFNVITFGAGVTNPVLPYADEVVICPNDGKELPNIYLCGANDSRFIQTGITNTTSMVWEKLGETSCAAVTNEDCANEDAACTWNQVATGPDYTVDNAGQYRLTLNYDGGCFNQFYFNVYTNLLTPTVTSRDIYCTTPGEIVVGGVPSGYEYSIDGTNYQNSNIFSVTAAGLYNVYIRQIGVSPNPCIFSVPDVQIRDRDFTVSTIINQPLCYGELGSIILAANDVRPQYFFSIYDGATLVNSVGPITPNDYTFDNLSPGIYTVNVSTEDGCAYTEDIEIINPLELTATAAITKPLTCTDGEITVYPEGGTPPYSYFVNSTTVFQGTPIINVTTAGVYNITVVDYNNCSVDLTISVDTIPAPDYTVSKTDISCADDANSGAINFSVTNPNGNTLEYSIDNGANFSSSPVFTGLATGDYEVIIQYTFGPDVCATAPQAITINTASAINGIATITAPYTCTTNGEITVSGVSGGTAPYDYSIDGITFQSGTTFTGLSDGAYTITIRDAVACTFLASPITINSLNPPSDLDFSNSPISCPSITSDVTLSTTGGTTPLEYRIISPTATSYQTSNIFVGLSPDTYTFEVRDANDCVYTESYTIPPLPSFTISTVITKDLDCTTSPNGIITGNISGGTSPFNYQVSYNGGAYGSFASIGGSTFSHTASADGTYQFLITDANGCTTDSGALTINAITLPEITSVVQTQPILCNGDNNAAIEITINNSVGTPAFVINVFNNTTGIDYSTQTSGLTAGDYTITLTDSKSCTDVENITISEPNPINVTHSTVPITCTSGGVSKGSVIINSVSGGTVPYNYFVTGTNGYSASELNASGTVSSTFDVVDFGLYQINVVDNNGCSVLIQDVLVASPPNDLDITINATAACISGGEAVVNIGTTLVGTGPFYFDIYRGFVPPAPPGGTWIPEDSPGSQSATFSGLIPGVTYTFIVYDDSTGCSYYESASSPIPTNSTLTATGLTSNNITCVGSNDGNVSLTINSIYGIPTNVNYEIYDSLSLVSTGVNGSGVVPSGGSLAVNNLGPLSTGNYFVLITETTGPNAGCSVVSVPFNITESAIDLNLSASVDKDANCNPNSGLISAIASDGTAPYEFQITTSATPPLPTDPSWASANTFNVNAGSYYVHVMDAYGCIKSTPVLDVQLEAEPIIDATVNNQCTATEGNFVIDVTLTSPGIPPYSYSIDGGAFQNRTAPFSITNLNSGNHTIEILDANGCGNLVSVDIESPIGIIPDVTTIPTCNDDDGEITITGSGGSGTYIYAISPNPASITLSGNVFSGVPSGSYTVTITDAITTCSENVNIFVPAATPLAFTTSPSPVTCFGDNDGTIAINITNYTGPYEYEVFDSSSTSVYGVVSANTSTNPEIVTGLLSGDYTIVVTETASPFCSTTSNTISIGSPLNALTVVATETSNVTCDNNNGTITAVADGGWGSYEYELTGSASVAYSSNGTFTNLSAGVYTINVRDAGGCIASDNVTLVVPNPINATVTASTNLLLCYGDTNASIIVSVVTGGQGSNYSYTLNMISPTASTSGPQSSDVFNNLGAGTYNVVVTDGYNCSFNSPNLTIAEPTEIQADLVKETSQTCTTDSTLTLSANGGTGTYEYSDTASFSTVIGSFATSTTFSVPVGSYQYFIRDANNCISVVSNEITIDPLPTLQINLDVTNATINCAGDSTGVIVATAQGGLGSYVYTLEDTSGNPISPVTEDSPGVFTNLPVGNYQVRVVSGDCLTTSAQIPITEPAEPLTASFVASNVTCPGTNNGMLEITASGGTGVIKYAISLRLDQFFDTSTFENLSAGNYQAIAQDELGCYIIFDFIIEDPIPVSVSIVPNSIIPEACSGDLDGEFSIEVSGGEMPYFVSLDDINGPYTTGTATQTQFDFTGLAGGDHIVHVLDNLGCPTEWNISFPESVLIEAELEIEYCTNSVDASSNMVTVNVDDSNVDLNDLDYSLNGGAFQTSNIFIDLVAGSHSITVRHTNTCEKTLDFEIEQFDPLGLVLEDGEINQIVAATSGGSGNYEYTLNGENYGSSNTFLIYESGDYTVTVTDSNGCIVSATRYYEYIDVCIPNYFTPNGDGTLDEWGPGCTSQYRDLTFDIFDRYGRKIATLRVGEKWDGKYHGLELPTGDYWYVVRLNDTRDDREFVGHFTLYR